MSYSLNSFKECSTGDYSGSILGVIEGDTWSLDFAYIQLASFSTVPGSTHP